jgi:hypothetical protein
MDRAQYFVVLHNDEWKIKHGEKHYGPYSSQAAAIRAAVDSAHQSGLLGHDAKVLIQGMNNQIRTEWTCGHDPYPPPGR